MMQNIFIYSYLICSSSLALSVVPVSRRTAVACSIGCLASTAVVGTACVDRAIAADAGESIRRGAANIPGYGPTDVFYPELFQGKWKVIRDVVVEGQTTSSLEYDMRFIQSIESNAVVADRGYNQAALERAQSPSATIRSYEWVETNPNDLRLVWEDGSRKEIKVTKRASERTEDTVSCSEFQRITTEDARGIPIIVARRTLTKWKIVSDSSIEGLEIVYDMGGGDPLAGATASAGPQVLAKSRLHLQRIQ
jgi:hypothetical protein